MTGLFVVFYVPRSSILGPKILLRSSNYNVVNVIIYKVSLVINLPVSLSRDSQQPALVVFNLIDKHRCAS